MVVENVALSRRGLLTGSTLAAAGLAAGMPLSSVWAKAPMAGTQVPYWYRFKIGNIEATVISDGVLPLGEAYKSFQNTSKGEVDKMLTDNFLDPKNWRLEQNALVLNTGDKLILFDTGMGSSQLFGPTPGKMVSNLKAAGIDPKNIDAVVCTHGHCDHVWGIMADDGTRHYPNAQIYINQIDFDFWTDEAKLSMKDPAYMKPFVEGARRNLLPNRDRIIFVKDGQEFLPGIQAKLVPGHTLGHTVYIIASGGQTLVDFGDTAHHQVVLLEKPLIQFAYDTDPKMMAQSRVRLLDMLATDRIQFIAYHFPWPGIGHVAKHGEGFHYYPTPMKMQG